MTTTTDSDVLLGDGLRSSPHGFGGMTLSGVYGAADEEESLRTLRHALDRGIRHLDTADVYGRGGNERLVGRLLRERRRDEVLLATKFGILPESDAEGYRARGDAAHVRSSLEASLTRLGTDHVDLYYYHRVDPRVPIEETVGALAELVREGLVRHIGLSEATAGELERASAVHPIAAVQSEWSIWSRDIEDHVVPTARRLGVGIVAYSPLGRGFLVGGAAAGSALPEGDARRNFPRFDDERRDRNAVIAETVAGHAARLGITPAQLSLAWVSARGRALGVPVVPIPSTRRAARIDENLGALAVRLDEGTLAALDVLGALVDGDRARDALSISQGRERREQGER
ncbi:aldo/keto reductase [Herbiconiux sp. SYSU D00978]|uniref:aldo/keto reductase n=1 Tax=Herbiconiux sp. SYSU D00978 TaxID=2812562 RepID=UPI001A95CFBA|nr:aldo/keto reductase [Herbiconiux sp. SYSU D00978]